MEQVKIQCLELAKNYSNSFEELVRNADELYKFVTRLYASQGEKPKKK